LDSRIKSITFKDTPLNLKVYCDLIFIFFKKDRIRFGVQLDKKDLNHLHQLVIQVKDRERDDFSHIINIEAQIGIVMYDMADPESYKQTIYHLEELKNKGSPKSGTTNVFEN